MSEKKEYKQLQDNNEIFRDIPGYAGKYQAGDLGNIKTFHFKEERLFKLNADTRGYYSVGLAKNKKKVAINVHKLVAMAFMGHTPCGHKKVIHHKNENKLDNRLVNLVEISQRANCFTAYIGTSAYKGVCWDKEKGKWLAAIRINNKKVFLGRFEGEKEAGERYKKALDNIDLFTTRKEFRNLLDKI